MGKFYIFYNPKSCNDKGTALAKGVEEYLSGKEYTYVDVTALTNYAEFVSGLKEDDNIVIAGGDGTLNNFINATRGVKISSKVWYYPSGSGNDFWNDVVIYGKNDKKDKHYRDILCIDEYLKRLPEVSVDGRNYLFLNNVGFGLDGYCCEEADRQKAKNNNKKINYTLIALKALLYAYKPTNAKVTVDGVTREYRKVWLAPTMNGRFYGGGIMATPGQDRLNDRNTVSVMIVSGAGKFKLLPIFPKIFNGTHVTHTDVVDILQGKHVVVEFNRPSPVQIDGETVRGIKRYEVKAYTQS